MFFRFFSRFLLGPALAYCLLHELSKRYRGVFGHLESPRVAAVCVGLMTAAFSMIFGTMAVGRYLSGHGTFFDLGVYELDLHDIAQGHWSILFSHHLSPLLGAVAAPYRLWPSAVTLLIIQTVVLATGVPASYRLGSRVSGSSALGIVTAGAYLLNPTLEFATVDDFHPDALFVPLLLWAAVYGVSRRRWAAGAFLCGSAGVKETFLPGLALFGGLVWKQMRSSRIAIAWVGLIITLGVVYGQFGGQYPIWRENRLLFTPFGYLGETPASVLKGLLIHADQVSAKAFTAAKGLNLVLMLGPLGYLPLWKLAVTGAALPGMAVGLLSPEPLHLRYDNHYALAIVPFFLIAGIFAIADRGRGESEPATTPRKLVVWFASSALYYSILVGPAPWSVTFLTNRDGFGLDRYFDWNRRAAVSKVIRQVPSAGTLLVQNSIWHSSLASRTVRVRPFPVDIEQAQTVLLDMKGPAFVRDRVNPTEFAVSLNDLRRDFRVAASEDGLTLWVRQSQR